MSDRAKVPSREYVRRVRRQADKFQLDTDTLGIRYAIQQHREIGRLHTFHPGERAELDYTKYRIWLYPSEPEDEPQLFQTGIGIDHASGVIKGYVVTAQPTSATAIRLYKRCVLPPRLWLKKHLQQYAADWDVGGIDRLVAIDNAMDLRGESPTIMLIALGSILLRMPPARGDLKGTIERSNWTLETTKLHLLPGYVHAKYPFTDKRMRRIIKRAKEAATLTVDEYEEMFVLAVKEFNFSPHPRYEKPRIAVYREGLEVAPMVLPTGLRQVGAIFALTFSDVKVTREGVEIRPFKKKILKYNSPELNELYRHGVEYVDVKLNVDDVRSSLILHRGLDETVEARLQTESFAEPTTFELAREYFRDDVAEGFDQGHPERFFEKLEQLRAGGGRNGRNRGSLDAVVDAAAMSPVKPPSRRTLDDAELSAMFGKDADVPKK